MLTTVKSGSINP